MAPPIPSHTAGTGPFYRLRIINPNPHGILTRSYDFYEVPRLTGSRTELGLPARDGRPPARGLYHLTPQGLKADPQ